MRLTSQYKTRSPNTSHLSFPFPIPKNTKPVNFHNRTFSPFQTHTHITNATQTQPHLSTRQVLHPFPSPASLPPSNPTPDDTPKPEWVPLPTDRKTKAEMLECVKVIRDSGDPPISASADAPRQEGMSATPAADLLKLDGKKMMSTSPFGTQEEWEKKQWGGEGEEKGGKGEEDGGMRAQIGVKIVGRGGGQEGGGDGAKT